MGLAEETLRRDTSGREQFNAWFREKYERLQREQETAHMPSMAIVATKGTLDWAYPPFISAPPPRRWAGTSASSSAFTASSCSGANWT
jgi:hypothetical protein